MKFLSKITCIALALGLVFSLSSCGDDDGDCYKCDEFDFGGYTIPATTVCVGDDDGYGGVYTQATLDAEVAQFEALGGSCD